MMEWHQGVKVHRAKVISQFEEEHIHDKDRDYYGKYKTRA